MDNSLALNDRRSGGERRNSDGTARFVESAVTTIATELAKRMKPKPLKPVEQKFLDLMEGRRAGHMGDDEYANGGMKEWDRFLTEHPEYYVPMEEQALIERCASASARLLDKNQKITLVSRGPGTKFAAKEGALIRAFRAAGIEVAKVVYIDFSKAALNQSVREGKALLPQAEHEVIQADIFDPETGKLYDVIGREVGACFGLTPMNAEGRHDGMPPISAVEKNLSGIRKQMQKGSHFIAVYDHNPDPASIEEAYSGQGRFAKHMLKHHFGLEDEGVDFVVEYGEHSHILAHGFHFNTTSTVTLGNREREIKAGTTLWFNNSVKLPKEDTVECHGHSGFAYPTEEKVIMADNGRLGYHHTIAI